MSVMTDGAKQDLLILPRSGVSLGAAYARFKTGHNITSETKSSFSKEEQDSFKESITEYYTKIQPNSETCPLNLSLQQASFLASEILPKIFDTIHEAKAESEEEDIEPTETSAVQDLHLWLGIGKSLMQLHVDAEMPCFDFVTYAQEAWAVKFPDTPLPGEADLVDG